MNSIQMISRRLEADRLKLQMGLDPAVDIDIFVLRGMWRRLKLERERAMAGNRIIRAGDIKAA